MRTCDNKIRRTSISILIMTALIVLGLFSYPNTVEAKTVEKTVTKYHLDMGAQHLWGSGTSLATAKWEKGRTKGGPIEVSASLTFPKEVKNVKAYPYAPSKFQWGEEGYTFNANKYLTGEKGFADFYKNYASTHIYNVKATSSGTSVDLSYTATLDSRSDFDLKLELNYGQLAYIFDLMGGEATVKANYPETYQRLVEGANNGLGNNVYGFMYFTPVIIEYDIVEMVEVGEIDANLTMPTMAKQNENYTVSDSSYVSSSLNVNNGILEKQNGSGSWQRVTTWQGTGKKGENTGGTAQEMAADIGEITYRLTLTTDTGQSDTDMKTITITDGREIDGIAKLELPEFTYEGHKAGAVDVSEFKVDGISYSARRAYEEGVATNGFTTVPSGSGRATKTTKTTADVVFQTRGSYSVKLTADISGGQRLTDIKPIEVRKTPYIIDRLGGFQKQNRKQLLNISVATYPDKPIVDYYIELKDMKTGQSINLTKAKPQENTASIKTRTHTTNGDKYWTNFQLEFLTKTPAYNPSVPKEEQGQEFRYTIYMKDSKGDTDTKQQLFKVMPDIPPQAEIIMQDTHLRNKGSNVADVIAEDGTTTDGDQVVRTWTLEAGQSYTDLSFGSKQKIKVNKTGVGKTTIKLFVKDQWNEPTLEEYITPADYLSDTTEKNTNILNIAPEVRLEAINAEPVNIGILAESSSKAAIENKVNSLLAKFIEKGYDPKIQVLSKATPDKGPMRTIGFWEQPVAVNCGVCSFGVKLDTEFVYRVVSAGLRVEGHQDVCIAPHTIQAIKPKSEQTGEAEKIQWSYTVNQSSEFIFEVDKQEKYAYIICSDIGKTIILNRNTGAYINTLNYLIVEGATYSPKGSNFGVFYSPSGNIFSIGPAKVQKISGNTGALTTFQNKGGELARLEGGKATFVGKSNTNTFYIGKLNLEKERFENIGLPSLPLGKWEKGPATVIQPTDMDAGRYVTFKQEVTDANDNDRKGAFFWIVDRQNQKVILKDRSTVGQEMISSKVGIVKDEKGNGKYIYFAHVEKHGRIQSPKWSFYLELYSLEGELLTSYSKETGAENRAPMIYASLNTKEQAIYLKEGSNIESSDFGGNQFGRHIKITLPQGENKNYTVEEFTPNALGFDLFEEYGETVDGYYGTYMEYDMWLGMTARTKVMQKPITEEEATAISIKTRFVEDPLAKTHITKGTSGDPDVLFQPMIDALEKTKQKVLRLTGDGDKNAASLLKNYTLEADTQYGYEYNLRVPTGKAVDLFHSSQVEKSKLTASGENFYGKVVAERSFSSPAEDTFFESGTSYYLKDRGGLGSGYYGKKSERKNFSCFVKFTMKEEGWVEFDYFRYSGGSSVTKQPYTINVDNRLLESVNFMGAEVNEHKFLFLPAGEHEIILSGYNGYSGYIGLDNIKVGYLSKKDNVVTAASTQNNEKNTFSKVQNTFTSPKMAVYTKEKLESVETEAIGTARLNIVSTGNADSSWSISDTGASMGSGYYDQAKGYFEAQAGADEMLIITYKESLYALREQFPVNSGTGEMFENEGGQKTIVLHPGETITRTFACMRGSSDGAYGSVTLSDVKTVSIKPAELNIPVGSKFSVPGAFSKGTIGEEIYEIQFSGNNCTLTNYAVPKQEELSLVGLQSKGVAGGGTISAEVKDFNLYKIKNGVKETVVSQVFGSEEALLSNEWKQTATGNGKVEIVEIEEKMEEETPLIYKKGQLVAYNLFYSDYENDPSKRQYWRYTHTPFNDGEHPEANTILNGEGEIVKTASPSSILPKTIPRFYVDGKYTVEHWQEDNTNRKDDTSGTVDYNSYDKASNIEAITFYIEGGASAPWVNSIKTVVKNGGSNNLHKVSEGESFNLKIEVDDEEKDVLSLITEVYRDKKLIYRHQQKNIEPLDIGGGLKGKYPTVETGLVTALLGSADTKALVGNYEVVCTVRDQTGTGLKSYKFTVVSEGKITGEVNHTDQWDQNRKKYNMKKFGEEVNSEIPLAIYLKMEEPRKRGTNVFWSGEKFILEAAIGGTPQKVTTEIVGYNSYNVALKTTGEKNGKGEVIYKGQLWNQSMINKWGRKEPQPLTFRFTATYTGNQVKTHDVQIIVDSKQDYWQLHRLW